MCLDLAELEELITVTCTGKNLASALKMSWMGTNFK